MSILNWLDALCVLAIHNSIGAARVLPFVQRETSTNHQVQAASSMILDFSRMSCHNLLPTCPSTVQPTCTISPLSGIQWDQDHSFKVNDSFCCRSAQSVESKVLSKRKYPKKIQQAEDEMRSARALYRAAICMEGCLSLLVSFAFFFGRHNPPHASATNSTCCRFPSTMPFVPTSHEQHSLAYLLYPSYTLARLNTL